jgi:hypothetical protein
LDLDVKAMDEQNLQLTASAFIKGENIYKNGGNSESFAVLTLQTGFTASVSAGTVITGLTNSGGITAGFAYEQA